MQELPALDPERLGRREYVDEACLRTEHCLERSVVRVATTGVAHQRGDRYGVTRGWLPQHRRDVHGLLHQCVGQEARTGSDHGRGSGQAHAAPPSVTRSTAVRAAAAFDRKTQAPASFSIATWARSPCGSSRVPTTLATTGTPACTASLIGPDSSAAGSAAAACPSTTSSSTTPVAGSAISASSRSTRTDPSIIGCGRPWVKRSSPKSIIV